MPFGLTLLTFAPRRRWLRLSLRGLMVLVLVVGGAVGWLAHTIRTQRVAIAAVKAAQGQVTFDYQKEQVGLSPQGRPVYRKEPAAPAWLRRWLGDELFQAVVEVTFRAPITGEIFPELARFDRLERLQITDLTGGGEGFQLLRGLSQLDDLRVAGVGVTDATLGAIAQISALRLLRIGKSAATDTGFVALAAHSGLTALMIEDAAHLTGPGATRLAAGLPRLTNFWLVGMPKLGDTLATLARHHPDLTILNLDRTKLTAPDFPALARLTQIAHLRLVGTGIDDVGLSCLRPLQDLKLLAVSGPELTDAGLVVLGDLAALRDLTIGGPGITDAGLDRLAQLPLTRLDIAGAAITDAGMPVLGRITSLTMLRLTGMRRITDAGLTALDRLVNLQDLTLLQTGVTPQGVATLRRAVPTLRRVVIPVPRPRPTGDSGPRTSPP